MITKQAIIGNIGVYVHRLDGQEDRCIVWGTKKKDITYLHQNYITYALHSKYPIRKNENGNWIYSLGYEVQVQDYDRIVELLRSAQP